MRKLAFIAATLVAALAAGPAFAANRAASFTGVVIGSQHGVLLVSSPSGVVRSFAGRMTIGERIGISGAGIHLMGRVHRAVLRGIVVRHRGNLTFLSAAHHVLVVRSAARSVASARDAAPAPGTVVQDTVGITATGELDEENEDNIGTSNQVAVQAVVTAVGTATVTITVNGQALTIPLPAGLTLPASIVGSTITLNLAFANGQANATPQGDDDQGDDDLTSQPSTATQDAGTSGSITLTGSTSGSHGDHHGGAGGDDD